MIDERPFARSIAGRYDTDHHDIDIEPDIEEALTGLIDVYDEPFADSSNIPTYMISEFARRRLKVVLSGDGGDELFGGYGWYNVILGELDIGNPRFEAAFTALNALL